MLFHVCGQHQMMLTKPFCQIYVLAAESTGNFPLRIDRTVAGSTINYFAAVCVLLLLTLGSLLTCQIDTHPPSNVEQYTHADPINPFSVNHSRCDDTGQCAYCTPPNSSLVHPI
jgi:hypothetical protein